MREVEMQNADFLNMGLLAGVVPATQSGAGRRTHYDQQTAGIVPADATSPTRCPMPVFQSRSASSHAKIFERIMRLIRARFPRFGISIMARMIHIAR
jgi:hypothetical protein